MTGPASGPSGSGTSGESGQPRRCPFDDEFVADPHTVLSALREEAPAVRVAAPNGRPVWLLTHGDDVRRALADPRLSLGAGHAAGGSALHRTLVNYDAPDHTRLRRLAAPAFTPSALAPHRARIADRIGSVLDAVGDTSVDALTRIAYPFTLAVMCDLFEVPERDRPAIGDAVSTLFRLPGAGTDRGDALEELHTRFRHVIRLPAAGRAATPLGAIVEAWRTHGDTSEDEVVSLCTTLLLGGFESSAQMIGITIGALADHPSVLRRLRAQELGPRPVIEEILRCETPGPSATPRTALSDVEIAGTIVRAGERVVPSIAAANRDPESWPRPDTFDVDRRGAGRHVTFGHGPHYCPGSALARMELEVLLEEITRRFALVKVVRPGTWRGSHLMRGMHGLIVRFEPPIAGEGR